MVIYKINFPNKKVYIGQTTDKLNNRISHHKTDANLNRDISEFNPQGTKICNAIRKYGLEDGWIEVIDSAKTIEELNDKEEFWVKKYNSDATGYNIKPGGGNRKLAESTKQKIGLATKKRWENKEIAEKMLAGLRKGTESAIKNQKGKLKVSRIKITCQICNSVFEDRTAKNRKFCSKKCAAKNASIIAKLKNENVC